MGASLTSPGIRSRSNKNYQLDGYIASKIPISKSTIGFRDKSTNSSNIFKSGFLNALNLKKLNINSSKKRQNAQSNISNDVLNQPLFNEPMTTEPIETQCQNLNTNQNTYHYYNSKQPPAPIHHHSRLSTKNLTKSLSCYTLRFNSRSDQDQGEQEYKKTVLHASTSELLKCLGIFICRECYKLEDLQPESIISWIRALDRSLILQGWSEIAFINPANVVFLYMLLKGSVDGSIQSERELQCVVLTCLYVAYSYMGNEISYPLKPFMVDENRDIFWERSISIVNRCSCRMLKLNSNNAEFTDVFSELRFYLS